jgi:hypothetical protein
MKVVVALALTALPACSAPPLKSDAGVAVVWNRVEDPHAVCQSLSGRPQFLNILGCAHRTERVCSIYAPAPRSEQDLQRFATLGHELMHCFDGDWHDSLGRMKQ